MRFTTAAAVFSLLCPIVAVASDPAPAANAKAQSDYARLESSLLKIKEVTTPSVRLTQRYKSMQGPKSIKGFQLDTDAGNERVWIRRYKVDVLDDAAAVDSTEFLCHAWLMADTGYRDPESGVRGKRGGRDPSLFLTISQGLEDMQFPDGFAVKFDTLDIRRVGLLTMAVNNNHEEIDKEIQFRASIEYLNDQAAASLGVKPLTGFQLHARQKTTEVATVHHHGHGSGEHPPSHTPRVTDHWMVPPGRQVLRSDVQPGVIDFDGTIHFIKIHLHPYGESVALIDKTTGEQIWKGHARNHADRAHLLGVDFYSSTTGMPIYRDRAYELVTVYNNPTDEPIDAMAVMRLYVHGATELAPPSRNGASHDSG